MTEAVLDSKVSTADAQTQVLDFLKKHINPGDAPLAGNSVHADKRFLEKEMPDIVNYLHYRIVGKYRMLITHVSLQYWSTIDVSTIKELARRWYPDIAAGVVKKNTHRALDDIKESIAELQYYQQRIFIPHKDWKWTRSQLLGYA